jgi:hypothetical protein
MDGRGSNKIGETSGLNKAVMIACCSCRLVGSGLLLSSCSIALSHGEANRPRLFQTITRQTSATEAGGWIVRTGAEIRRVVRPYASVTRCGGSRCSNPPIPCLSIASSSSPATRLPTAARGAWLTSAGNHSISGSSAGTSYPHACPAMRRVLANATKQNWQRASDAAGRDSLFRASFPLPLRSNVDVTKNGNEHLTLSRPRSPNEGG